MARYRQFGSSSGKPRFDVPMTYTIARYVMGRSFERHAPGHTKKARLGGTIRGIVGTADCCSRRGNIDYTTPFARNHVWKTQPGHTERTGEIHVEDALPNLIAMLRHRLMGADPGGIHQDVDRAKSPHCLTKEFACRRLGSHIETASHHTHAQIFNLRARQLEFFGARKIRYTHCEQSRHSSCVIGIQSRYSHYVLPGIVRWHVRCLMRHRSRAQYVRQARAPHRHLPDQTTSLPGDPNIRAFTIREVEILTGRVRAASIDLWFSKDIRPWIRYDRNTVRRYCGQQGGYRISWAKSQYTPAIEGKISGVPRASRAIASTAM